MGQSSTERFSVTSIILSRFILDLRHDPNEDPVTASHHTSIHFASRIQDNLGASLNSIWGSGAPRDSEEVEDRQLSDSPRGESASVNEDRMPESVLDHAK